MTVDPREQIVEHLPSMRAFAVSLTRDGARADDVVQDAILKAWNNFEKFREGTNLRAWLFTIVRNTYYSELRRSRREVSDTDGAMAATLSEKPEHDGRLAMADFEKVFDKLPDEQREALVLVGASGLSYEEAAETCGVAVGTIKSRVNRARAKLTELMAIAPGDSLDLTDSATLAVLNASTARRNAPS
ncbi:MAG: RNA polymerase sigma factor [Pseudomonadota bacterium]